MYDAVLDVAAGVYTVMAMLVAAGLVGAAVGGDPLQLLTAGLVTVLVLLPLRTVVTRQPATGLRAWEAAHRPRLVVAASLGAVGGVLLLQGGGGAAGTVLLFPMRTVPGVVYPAAVFYGPTGPVGPAVFAAAVLHVEAVWLYLLSGLLSGVTNKTWRMVTG